ncbi:organomercurial lyase [Actinospica robiniae]|uniref:organomercurial lyase n=1 Tax=Actinospica robiniae TaxID=304901 RepID=UPI0003FE068B|nr:organomercurial lyase [Actinospica robiniae]
MFGESQRRAAETRGDAGGESLRELERSAYLALASRRCLVQWENAVQACHNQWIFCSEDFVDVWLAKTSQREGSVFGLDVLWRLAAHWYEGRLDSPYRR